MPTYLTADQIELIKRELTILFSLPYATDLFGTAWEQILADAKGGKWVQGRANRAKPDFYIPVEGAVRNYSVKCEHLTARKNQRKNAPADTPTRADAVGWRGDRMDFIIARPKVDELLEQGQTIDSLKPTELGSLVLRYYNERIVAAYQWHVLTFVAPVIFKDDPNKLDFIYWEEEPPTVYDPAGFWWQDTGRATGSNRNIAGYPLSVSKDTNPLPAAKFRWTSGGKQFYVLYEIPGNADVWSITKVKLTSDEVWDALQHKLADDKAAAGVPPKT